MSQHCRLRPCNWLLAVLILCLSIWSPVAGIEAFNNKLHLTRNFALVESNAHLSLHNRLNGTTAATEEDSPRLPAPTSPGLNVEVRALTDEDRQQILGERREVFTAETLTDDSIPSSPQRIERASSVDAGARQLLRLRSHSRLEACHGKDPGDDCEGRFMISQNSSSTVGLCSTDAPSYCKSSEDWDTQVQIESPLQAKLRARLQRLNLDPETVAEREKVAPVRKFGLGDLEVDAEGIVNEGKTWFNYMKPSDYSSPQYRASTVGLEIELDKSQVIAYTRNSTEFPFGYLNYAEKILATEAKVSGTDYSLLSITIDGLKGYGRPYRTTTREQRAKFEQNFGGKRSDRPKVIFESESDEETGLAGIMEVITGPLMPSMLITVHRAIDILLKTLEDTITRKCANPDLKLPSNFANDLGWLGAFDLKSVTHEYNVRLAASGMDKTVIELLRLQVRRPLHSDRKDCFFAVVCRPDRDRFRYTRDKQNIQVNFLVPLANFAQKGIFSIRNLLPSRTTADVFDACQNVGITLLNSEVQAVAEGGKHCVSLSPISKANLQGLMVLFTYFVYIKARFEIVGDKDSSATVTKDSFPLLPKSALNDLVRMLRSNERQCLYQIYHRKDPPCAHFCKKCAFQTFSCCVVDDPIGFEKRAMKIFCPPSAAAASSSSVECEGGLPVHSSWDYTKFQREMSYGKFADVLRYVIFGNKYKQDGGAVYLGRHFASKVFVPSRSYAARYPGETDTAHGSSVDGSEVPDGLNLLAALSRMVTPIRILDNLVPEGVPAFVVESRISDGNLNEAFKAPLDASSESWRSLLHIIQRFKYPPDPPVTPAPTSTLPPPRKKRTSTVIEPRRTGTGTSR